MQIVNVEHVSFAIPLTPRRSYIVGAILVVTGAALELFWRPRFGRVVGAIPLIVRLELLLVGVVLHLQECR